MNKVQRTVGALLLATLTIAGTACGSDDDADTASTSTAGAVATTTANSDVTATTAETADTDSAPPTSGAPATSSVSSSPDSVVENDAALDELIEKAKAEGTVVLYGASSEEAYQRLSDAFSEQYGVSLEFQQVQAGDMFARLQAEIDTQSGVADVALATLGTSFTTAAFEDGMFVPLSEGLPGYPEILPVELPELFVRDDLGTVAINVRPRVLGYNTDILPTPPTSWEDFADPAWQGKIAAFSPTRFETYLSFYSALLDEYGPEYLEALAKNVVWVDSVAAIQATAAGEYDVAFPSSESLVNQVKSEGAPIDFARLPIADIGGTGIGILATAPHPNAAALLAYFLLTPEGAEIMQEDLQSTVNPYSTDIPAEWTSDVWENESDGIDPERRAEILSLLGLE